MPRQFSVTLALLLLVPIFTAPSIAAAQTAQQTLPDLYFGIDIAYENITATKELVDKVSNFTNLFIIGCLGDYSETRLTTISEYVIKKGLTFIVYSDDPRYPSNEWVLDAKTKWGNKFIGIYVYDEPGGKQVDFSKFPAVHYATDYRDAAEKFIREIGRYVGWFRMNFSYPTQYDMFTSDYALYWYDYKAGYDTVFAEFGWNYSRQINVALVRGAATVLNKTWGAMLTWTYTVPPYIESGPELYNDMVLAYESGAKYIIVFDSNEDWTAGILQQEHFDAMKQFWEYAKTHPRPANPVSDKTAYVLPDDYAYGFRSPQDKIWGLWEADVLSTDLSMTVASMLQMFGNHLDIVYPDEMLNSAGYGSIVHWYDQRLLPPKPPESPADSPTPTPQDSPTPSASPSPTLSAPPQSPPITEGVPLLTAYAVVIGAFAGGVAVSALVFRLRKR